MCFFINKAPGERAIDYSSILKDKNKLKYLIIGNRSFIPKLFFELVQVTDSQIVIYKKNAELFGLCICI
ncbi:MAG: hypothetical protein B7Z06_08095 [Flavobacteriales bacterium 32-35-8]|nr:MAG: hypothetical protein B7Z06_08095 [Flavobacteriales bacterium 32-35-8]